MTLTDAPPRRRSALRTRLMLAAGSVVAGLLLLELALRLLVIAPPDPYGEVGDGFDREHSDFVADAQLGWRMRPQAVFTWQSLDRNTEYRADDDGFRAGTSV